MSSILNKLGLGSDSSSSASSSSSSSQSSGSMSSTRSGTTGSTSTTSSTNTMNKAGYADTTDYAHTGYGTRPAVTSQTTTSTTTQASGTTQAAGTTAYDKDYMTRSEERLLVGKEQVSAGTASLNKYATSEHVQTSVPITREHVVIEREPIQPGDNVRADIQDAHYELALKEERAVAAKETVPIEKVKLRKEVERGSQNVDADLRKEHIEYGTTNEPTSNKTLGTAPGTGAYSTTNTATGSSATNTYNRNSTDTDPALV